MKENKNKIRRFWVSSISEFVIVILGILIALQINNWNEKRKDKNLEKIILNEFLVNLESDLKDIDIDIEILDSVASSGEIILKYFEEGKPYNDSLKKYFGWLPQGTIFSNNISPYESLKSTGIDIISNDNLRRQITSLYSVRYRFMSKLEDFQHNLMSNFQYPIFSENLIMNIADQTASPIHPDEISKNHTLKESIKLNNIYIYYQINYYESLKIQITQLMEDIEKELGN